MELIFLVPEGELAGKGVFAGGEVVCRRRQEQGGWVDVVEGPDGRIQILRYSKCGTLQRTVHLDGNSRDAYKTIELQSAGLIGYSLMMTLIESEAVRDMPPVKK
jgi:hypothetical protein